MYDFLNFARVFIKSSYTYLKPSFFNQSIKHSCCVFFFQKTTAFFLSGQVIQLVNEKNFRVEIFVFVVDSN